jgi:hypothetical protein
MKKLFVLSVSLFFVLSVRAQPKITFDQLSHDFGSVNEAVGAVVHDFTFTNTGASPLIIKNVTTTCGCTTPEWPKQPIAPGAKGLIKVSYDVKGRPGAIDKTITVSNNGKPDKVQLRITGAVSPVDISPAEAYRYTAGNLRLDNMHVAFDRVYVHEKPSLVVTAYNQGPDALTVSFVNLPAHIKAEAKPAKIGKDEKASITLTYDAAKKNDWGFVSDRISMILNGDRSKEHKLTVTATIQEDFSRWTADQLQNAPVAVFDKTVIEAGIIKQGEKKTYTWKVTNSGKSKLLLRKVESSGQLTVTAPKEVAPGASAEIIGQYDATGQSGSQSKSLTVITNDPNNAQITLRLKAEVNE